MNTKDIEEIVEEVTEWKKGRLALAVHIRDILTTLTQHHKAEVERVVEDFAEQLKRSLGNYREYDSPWNDTWGAIEGTKEEVLQSIVTPTKTDKQANITSDE